MKTIRQRTTINDQGARSKEKLLIVPCSLSSCSRERTGQVLVEVLIALTVISISLTASYYVVITSTDLTFDKKLSDQASFLTHEALGAVRSIRDRDWFAMSAGTHGLAFDGTDWSLSGTSDVHDIFSRQVVVTDTASHTKRIDVKISWKGFPNISRDISVSTYLTKWTAEDLVFDTWLNPGSLGSSNLVPGGNQGQDVAVSGQYAYIAAHHADATSSDFFVFDVSSPAVPSLIRHIDTGLGLQSLGVWENDSYAFAISAEDSDGSGDGFKVIDISTPSSATTTTTYDVPGTAKGRTIFVSGDHAYIGTEADAGDEEFIVFDISDPAAATVAGSFEIGATVNDIWIWNSTAYLATAHDDKELLVLDVANPASIQQLGAYDWTDTEDVLSVFVDSPTRVALGRAKWSSGPEFQMLNASNPASIQALGSFEIGDDINDIAVIDWLAFLGTSDSNAELALININDLNNPTQHSTFNYSQRALGIDFEGDNIYAATRSNDGLRIMNSQ